MGEEVAHGRKSKPCVGRSLGVIGLTLVSWGCAVGPVMVLASWAVLRIEGATRLDWAIRVKWVKDWAQVG